MTDPAMDSVHPNPNRDVDAVVARIRALVRRHSGASPRLAKVRGLYGMFRKHPDAAAFGPLAAAVDAAERAPPEVGPAAPPGGGAP